MTLTSDRPPGQDQPDGPSRSSWVVTPFVRLSRVHALNSSADAMVAVALAGSLFFSIDPDAARSRVLLYLLFTIAPFALVGPFIGPAIDRAPGGRRAIVMLLMVLRAVAVVAMVPYLDSLLLFPLAFANLVLGKSYAVAKASIVPLTASSHEELVEKNSRLAVLSGVAGFVGAAPALAVQWLFDSRIALALAGLAYLGASVMGWKLPRNEEAGDQKTGRADVEVRTARITLSGSAMSVIRGVLGFMTFMIAFGFSGGTDNVGQSGVGAALGAGIREAMGFAVDDGTVPAWKLGLVLASSALGSLAGSVLAPRLRERTHEENLLLGALTVIAVFGLLSAWTGGLQGAGLLALGVGFAASSAKVAFDAIVQRDANQVSYAATFARFETRFQIVWVVGALVPVVFPIPPRLGFLLVALGAVLAAASFLVGFRTLYAGEDLDGRSLPSRGIGGLLPSPGRKRGESGRSLEVPSWISPSDAPEDAPVEPSPASAEPTPVQSPQPPPAPHGPPAAPVPSVPPPAPDEMWDDFR